MHGAFGSRKLHEHIAAVAVIVDHSLHTVKLAYHAIQPFLQVILHLLTARRGLVMAAALPFRAAGFASFSIHTHPFASGPPYWTIKCPIYPLGACFIRSVYTPYGYRQDKVISRHLTFVASPALLSKRTLPAAAAASTSTHATAARPPPRTEHTRDGF